MANDISPGLPIGYEFGYDQITASVNIVSTSESAGTTIIVCASHTFDGAPVMVEFFSPWVANSNASTAYTVISLFEGATQIGELVYSRAIAPGGSAQSYIAAVGKLRFTPSAGSHTYTVTAFTSAIGGSAAFVGAGPGGTGQSLPAFVRFTKV